jgi:hypothetical protein
LSISQKGVTQSIVRSCELLRIFTGIDYLPAPHTINAAPDTVSRRGMLVLLGMLVFGVLVTLWAGRAQMFARYTVDVVDATHRCTFYFDRIGKKNGESISNDCTIVPVSKRDQSRPHIAVVQGRDLSVRLALPGRSEATGTIFMRTPKAEHALATGKVLAVLHHDGTLGFAIDARLGLPLLAIYLGMVSMLFVWGLKDLFPQRQPEPVTRATPRFGRRIDKALDH